MQQVAAEVAAEQVLLQVLIQQVVMVDQVWSLFKKLI
jgi:hypothetical protein